MTIYKYDVIISIQNLMNSENYDVKLIGRIFMEIMIRLNNYMEDISYQYFHSSMSVQLSKVIKTSSESDSYFLLIVLNVSSFAKKSRSFALSYFFWCMGKTQFFNAILQEYVFYLGAAMFLFVYAFEILLAYFSINLPLLSVF